MTYLSDTKDKDSGLGYCNGSETAVCDREYTDAEAVDESGLTLAGSNDAVRYCPSCLESNKTYYYCQLHPDEPVHLPHEE